MDELFTLILIVVFVVLPMLEGLLKKRRRDGSPPEPEPEWAPDEAEPGTSEGMIPPDVWEELTGLPAPERPRSERAEPPSRTPPREASPREAPPPPRPEAPGRRPSGEPPGRRPPDTRAPRPEPAAPLPVARGEIGEGGEAATLARTGRGATAPLPPPPGRPSGRRTRGSSAARLVSGLRGGRSVDELRRAVLYREVLGPPVSLRRDPGPGDLPG